MPVQPSLAANTRVAVFAQSGTLTTGTGVGRMRVDVASTIVGVDALVNTAPTGSSIIIDVNKNGTTVYTTQANRVAIAAGANAGSQAGTPDVTSLSVGDYLTVDLDQIGSSTAGANLTVFVRYQPT